MAVEAGRARVERGALERAVVAGLVAVIVVVGAWLGAFIAVDPGDRMLVAAGGGVAALAISLATAVTAYFVEDARRLRRRLAGAESGGAWLEGELRDLVERSLPSIIARLGEGASPQATMAQVPPVRHPALRELLRLVAEGMAAGERGAVRARSELAALETAASELAGTALPILVKRIRGDRASAETVLAELAPAPHPALEELVGRIAAEFAAGERTSAAARAACASAAARIQAQTTRTHAQLRELQDRYSEDEVFGDLLVLDHGVSQMGRLADSIALLSGGRSGRRWTKPIAMESIVRGALGRIAAYQRVRWHSTSTAAIAGFAAEGVMHALAELMDNATSFSPPGTAVHVYVEEEGAGVVITVEDGGLGMRQRERQRAERLVSEVADLTSLPGTRLGLAVVGRLARKHGLTVSFRPSSRGGVGVVVLIPRRLIVQASVEAYRDVTPDPATPGLAEDPRGSAAAAIASAGPYAAEDRSVDAAAGDAADQVVLPRRRRGATLAAAPIETVGTESRPRDPGARFAAFQRSTGGRHRPAPGQAAAGGESTTTTTPSSITSGSAGPSGSSGSSDRGDPGGAEGPGDPGGAGPDR